MDSSPDKSTEAASSWLRTLTDSLKTQAATWIVGSMIAVLAVFPSYFTDRIKFALNTADLRSKYFEEFAENLSAFSFEAELVVEYLGDGVADRDSWDKIGNEYNPLITTLRNKEYVYLAWISRYWGGTRVYDVETAYIAVKTFDSALHDLNPEFYKLKTNKIDSLDEDKVNQAMVRLRPALANLQEQSKKVLLELQ